jgi:hypothetical protein
MDPHTFINLFHVLLVAPFFIYVGVMKSAVPAAVYTTLIVLGAILVLYHGYKFVNRFLKGSSYAWVNAVHAFLIGPLLLYIGLNGTETGRPFYEALLLTAFAALGYHLYEMAVYRDFYV